MTEVHGFYVDYPSDVGDVDGQPGDRLHPDLEAALDAARGIYRDSNLFEGRRVRLPIEATCRECLGRPSASRDAPQVGHRWSAAAAHGSETAVAGR